MIDRNLILWLPFNEQSGNVAYDYSIYRRDATLSDAGHSIDRENGKALSLNGSGEAQTSANIPFDSNFTLAITVKTTNPRLGWCLNFSGVNNYIQDWFDVIPGQWVHLTFVKEGSMFTVFKDGAQSFRQALTSVPTGFSLSDPDVDGCFTLIDDVKMWNKAMSYTEIMKMWKSADVEYYLDGHNFKDFGVYVSASSGIVGRLARKESLTSEWDGYHGTVRDNKRIRYQSRKIVLDCFIEASTRTAFVEWMNRFWELMDGDGTHRLKIDVDGSLPLVYEVVQMDEADTSKEWGKYNEDLMVGTFKMTLIEDDPVKKVLRHVGNAGTTASITLSSYKMLDIHWGDGTHTYNVSGTNKTVTHTYEQEGEYDIIISGVIENIESFTTNAIVVWDKLK